MRWKGPNLPFCGYGKFLFFFWFWWDFFVGFLSVSTFKTMSTTFFTISHHFLDNFGQRGKKKFSRRKLLFCRAHLTDFEKILIYLKINIQHNCFKHVTVSNTLLCHAEYWENTYFQRSRVDMLRSYHAALAKDLSS